MTDHGGELLRRIEALEAENRRLRVGFSRWSLGVALVAGASVSAVVGCSRGGDSASDGRTPDRITAKAFVLVDDAGAELAVLKRKEGEAGGQKFQWATLLMQFHDLTAEYSAIGVRLHKGGEGKSRRAAFEVNELSMGILTEPHAILSVNDDGRAAELSLRSSVADESGASTTSSFARLGTSKGLHLADDKGGAELRTAAGLSLADAKGQDRALVGRAEHVNTETGTKTDVPFAFVLYKPDGHVLWMAPLQ